MKFKADAKAKIEGLLETFRSKMMDPLEWCALNNELDESAQQSLY